MTNYLYKRILLGVALGSVFQAEARPEYALQTHINQCTACHISPTGGGIKNQNGKLFGTHTFNTKKLKDEFYALDLRGQLGQAKRGAQVSKGFLLMNSIGSVQVPVVADSEGEDFTLVGSFNFGMMGVGLRETYVMLGSTDTTQLHSRVLLGKFPAPFGLQTDEHRTYTKVMINSTNREFESGAQWSGDPNYNWHLDFAGVNGFENDGTPVLYKNPWGLIGNLRYLPDDAKLFLGLSHSEHGNSTLKNPLTATSLYWGFSTERFFAGSLTTETVFAKGWNNATYNSGGGLAGAGLDYFIPASETAWRTALVDSASMGTVINLNWDYSARLGFLYRLEEFIPDVNFKGDYFHRDGLGFRKVLSSQSQVIFRMDSGRLFRSGVNVDGLKSIGENVFVLFHFWI